MKQTLEVQTLHEVKPKQSPPPDVNRLIRLPEVLTIIPVKKSTWWAWCKLGKAPAPVRLGRCTCWKYADVVAMTTAGGI